MDCVCVREGKIERECGVIMVIGFSFGCGSYLPARFKIFSVLPSPVNNHLFSEPFFFFFLVVACPVDFLLLSAPNTSCSELLCTNTSYSKNA